MSQPSSRPREEPRRSPLLVRRVPEETGVTLMHQLEPDHPMNRLYHSGYICGGVAVGDLDGDGRVDLFFASGPHANRLYRQVDTFQFVDVTQDSGIQDLGRWGTGVTMVDIDNDGDLDLYVCNYDAPNELWINEGSGHFEERAEEFGVNLVDASLMATFGDYDNDGLLDLYLVTYTYYYEKGRPAQPPHEMVGGQPRIKPEFEKYFAVTPQGPGRFGIEEYGRADYLLRNQGNGSFEDVTAKAGIGGHGFGLSACWFDYDADGDLDLYVCNDYDDPDRFYQNQGDGTFLDQLRATVPHTTWSSMGSDVGDINNDGLLDLFCVDMSATTHYKQKTTMGAMNAAKLRKVAGPPPQIMRNGLFLNAGNGRFWELAYLAQVADSDWSWAPRFIDLDNDGWQDLFISNGAVRSFNDSDKPFQPQMLVGRTYWDLYRDSPERPEQNLAFRNTGDLMFDDMSRAWGLDHVGMSYGAATADLDRDGDQDLIVVNLNEPIGIYENLASKTQRGVSIHLRGTASNRYGVGAMVELETSRGRQTRTLQPVAGFLGSSEPAVHFGLAGEDRVARLTIRWPSGHIQTQRDVPVAETSMMIHEDRSSENAWPDAEKDAEASGETLFHVGGQLTGVRHRERPFDDFQLQPLLPNQQSHWGPGLAWADVDGDGDEDLFLSGAAGFAGQLWLQTSLGQFELSDGQAWDQDAAAEDLGCVFFDADADGDQDLFVVSGGTEAGKEASQLQDRLYWNDGQGRFTRADSGVLPTEDDSGGAVTVGDFDRDGDLDLFVGGRMVPGKYPLAPVSRLLVNEGGRFVDRSSDSLKSHSPLGMITSALWTDVGGDGWLDLLVTSDWGPLRYFHNDQARLTERTEEAGFAAASGWWNSLLAIDVDHDQDLDYVAGNFGLNTKYHASSEKPALLFYGDFERNGKMHLVEAEYEGDELFPIRGRSCSSQSMPFLRQKFATYHDFALADLEELYTPDCLEQAHRFSATVLESVVWINDGKGQFTWKALPRLAQASPIFGLACAEMTGDRHLDVWCVQNFYRPQIETGRMDGGLSLLLAGTEDGQWQPLSVRDSGLSVPAEARAAAVCDLDGDAWPDLVAATNDGPLVVFTHRGGNASARLRIALDGPAGNRTGIGSQITVFYSDGFRQRQEVHGSSGYLSQSSRWTFWGVLPTARPERVEVRWPDGQTSEHRVEVGESSLVLSR